MFRFLSSPVPSRASARSAAVDVAALVVSVAGMVVAAPLINDITDVAPLAIALWRNLISLIVMAPVMLWQHRDRPPTLSWKDLVATLTAGLLFAVYLGLWIPSLHLSGVAVSTGLSFAVAPVWVMVIRRLRGERLPVQAWGGTLVAVLGVLALTGMDLGLSVRHLTGDLLALASGIAVAGYLVIGADTRARVDTSTFTTVCYAAAAAALAIACHVTGTATTGYSPASWAKIVALTVSVQVVGHGLNTRAVKTLGIGVTSTAILLETPGATVVEGLWHRTWPSLSTALAVLVVLIGLTVVVRSQPAGPAPVPRQSRWLPPRMPRRFPARILQPRPASRSTMGTTGSRRGHRGVSTALTGFAVALAAVSLPAIRRSVIDATRPADRARSR